MPRSLKMCLGILVSLFGTLCRGAVTPARAPLQNSPDALYTFQTTTGDLLDESQRVPRTDLKIVGPYMANGQLNSALIQRRTHELTLSGPMLIRSGGTPDFVNRCTTSNEFSVEIWLNNDSDRKVETEAAGAGVIQPMTGRILTLSSGPDRRLFTFGQTYDSGSRYVFNYADEGNPAAVLKDGFISEPEDLLVQQYQHIVFTRDARGVLRFFRSDLNGQLVLRSTRSTKSTKTSLGWANNVMISQSPFYLGLGNEVTYDHTQGSSLANENLRNWKGKLFLVAIYCRALTLQEILGEKAPFQISSPPEGIIHSRTVMTDARRKAKLIASRITGVRIPIDEPLLTEMETKLNAGQDLQAAALAVDYSNGTQGKTFYNITVRDMAARMSTREETINAGLNDFVAMMVGGIRDDMDARDFLKSNFTYRANSNLAAVSSDLVTDLLTSNRHYEDLQSGRFDLSRVLVKITPQSLYNGRVVREVPDRDAAGLITSRAFMAAHAIAGTNRRLVEYSFREFLCAPIEKWADASRGDLWIGRDIDRFPGGDNQRFSTTCKACHNVMDSLRDAFAKWTFSNGIVKHADYMESTVGNSVEESTTMKKYSANNGFVTSSKLNHNSDVFPGGHETNSDAFSNQAVGGSNALYFQWGSKTSGNGVRDFGDMIAQSKAYPRCLAKRVYRSVCKREPASFDDSFIDKVADEFTGATPVSGNPNPYRVKYLFQRIVTSAECIGTDFSEPLLGGEP